MTVSRGPSASSSPSSSPNDTRAHEVRWDTLPAALSRAVSAITASFVTDNVCAVLVALLFISDRIKERRPSLFHPLHRTHRPGRLDALDLTAAEIAAGDDHDAPGKLAQRVRERERSACVEPSPLRQTRFGRPAVRCQVGFDLQHALRLDRMRLRLAM